MKYHIHDTNGEIDVLLFKSTEKCESKDCLKKHEQLGVAKAEALAILRKEKDAIRANEDKIRSITRKGF